MKRTFLLAVILSLAPLPVAAQEDRYIRLDPTQIQAHVVGGVQKAKADCLFAVSKTENYLDEFVNITLAFGVEDRAAKVCAASKRFGTTSVAIAKRATETGEETVIASPEAIGGSTVPLVMTPEQTTTVLAWLEAGKGQYLDGLVRVGAIKGTYVTPTQ